MNPETIAQPVRSGSRRYLSPKDQEKRERAESARKAERAECIRRITAIVETVATARGVDWRPMLAKRRGSPQVADSRTLAVAMCCALGIPQYLVARSFQRTWASIYCAEIQCSRHYRKSAAFRKEWDSLFNQLTPKARREKAASE